MTDTMPTLSATLHSSSLYEPIKSGNTDGTRPCPESSGHRLSSSTTTTTTTTTRTLSICHCGNDLVLAGGLCNGDCEQHVLQHQHTVYYDPYTTLPEGYLLRTPPRWRRVLSKLGPRSSSSAQTSNVQTPVNPHASVLDIASTLLVGRGGGAAAKLTVRNLEEFFDPAAYDDEMDVFKDPKLRENPYDTSKQRQRVDQWIENLP